MAVQTFNIAVKSKSTGKTETVQVEATSLEEAKTQVANTMKARERLAAEDAQRGPVGSFFKNVSDSTADIASKIPLVGGLVDEGTAMLKTGLQGGNYDENLAYERERMQQFQERAPNAVKGMNYAPGLVAGAKMVPGQFTGSMPTQMLKSGGVGTVLGAEEGFTRGEGGVEQRAREMPGSAAFGGIFGSLAPPVAKIVGGAVDLFTRQAQRLPTVQEIKDLATAGYRQARAAGLNYTPQAWQGIVDDIVQKVESYGIGGPMHDITKAANPVTAGIVEKMQTMQQGGQPVPLAGVEQTKSITGNMNEPAAAVVSSNLKSAVDTATPADFMPAPPGQVQQGLEGIEQGRENWSRQLRAKALDEAKRLADIEGASKYTQAGKEHALRLELKKLVKSEDFKYWPPEERAAVEKVVTGSGPLHHLVRMLGATAPGSGGLSTWLSGLSIGTLPAEFTIPWMMSSLAARGTSRALTNRNMRIAEALTKTGKAPAPTQQAQDARRLAQQLMSGQSGRAGEASNRRFGH